MKSFVDKRLYSIRGFMHPADAMAFSGLLEHQTKNRCSGALVEIGVFFGRSLALMANSAGPDEQVLGIDLFDIPGQKSYVEDVFKRHELDQNVHLRAGSSLELSPLDILNKVGPVRFFSIDGGHELRDIEHDAPLALETLDKFGLIAFDDFMNPQYPDLSVGIIRFLEHHRESLRPVLITRAKLYVCRKDAYESYIDCARTMPLWAGAYREEFTFLGGLIAHVSQSILRRGTYEQLAARGLGELSGNVPQFRRNVR